MTVSTTTTEVSYTGDGIVTAFSVTFQFFGTTTTAELEVIERTIATGAEDTKVNGTDYTVSGGNNATGTVTATTAPASTVQWVIRRNTTQTQETDYVENDAFPAETHEDALDRVTMISQEQERDLGDSFKYPATYSGGASTAVPEPSAGKALKWNDAGDALENSDTDPDAAAAAAAASAVAAAASETAAAASETAAASSETNAATSETNAETAKDAAETAQQNAEAVATGFSFTFDNSTSMADPGTGDFRLNDATVANVTAIAFDATSAETGNPDVSNFIAAWDDVANATGSGVLTIKKAGTPATFAGFYVTSVTDNTGWLQVAVTHIASNGTWTASDRAFMSFAASGADGAGSLSNIVEDTTPQLGGNLDLNGHVVTGLEIGTDVQAFDADIPTVAASQAEMEAGTETALRSMSPQRVKQAIDANVSSGAWQEIGTATPSGASSVEFTGLTTYKHLMVVGQLRGSASAELRCRGSFDNGSTWASSGYQAFLTGINRSGTTINHNGSNAAYGVIHESLEGGSTYDTGFQMFINGNTATSGGVNFTVVSVGNIISQSGGFMLEHAGGNDVDGIQIYAGSGTLTGTVALFGAVSV